MVLYNFKSRHQDELDLKAGYKVTVIDTSDPDWWKGKCLGRVGFFPSKYVSKLSPGEKPLQVRSTSKGIAGVRLVTAAIRLALSGSYSFLGKSTAVIELKTYFVLRQIPLEDF